MKIPSDRINEIERDIANSGANWGVAMIKALAIEKYLDEEYFKNNV